MHSSEHHKSSKRQPPIRPWGSGRQLLWPFLVFLVLMAGFATSARASALTATANQSVLPLSGHLYWFRDGTTSHTLNDILLRDTEGAFEKARSYPSFGYTRDTIWIRFTLTNNDSDDLTRWLSVGPAFLDHVQLYEVRGENIIDHGTMGDHHAWSDRAIQSRYSVFPLSLTAQHTSQFYLRVSSSSSVAVEPTLWEPATYANMSSRDTMLFATLITALILLALLSLLLATLLKRKLFLYYFLYALSFASVMAIFEGIVHFIVTPDNSLRLEVLQVALQAVVLISLTSLFLVIVDAQTHLPRFARILSAGTAAYAAISLIPMLIGNIHISISMLWLAIAALYIAIPLMTFSLRHKVGKSAIIYSAAFAVLALSASIRFAWVFGLSGPNLLSENIAIIGVTLHMIILYIAITTRYVEIEQKMDQATKLALHAANKYSAQLKEEVSQRTKELDDTNQKLATQLAASEQSMAMLEKTRVRLTSALDAEKQAALEQRRFLRMVAHEFRTPLAVIQTAAEIIDNSSNLNDTVRAQNFQRIRLASSRMASLIDQALQEDKVDSVIWQKNAAWISVNELISQSASHGEMLSAGKHRIMLNLCPDHLIQGDQGLLITLLNNILENAVKYSPAGADIIVSTHVDAHMRIHICVKDHGRGMNQEEKRQVLDKYFRADNVSDIAGMGLGLYLVDRIAQLHDATLSIDSTPEQGTHVQISFKARPVQEASA